MKDSDPGIGDPLAPVGSSEWAKRWRLSMQSAMKNATVDQTRFCELWEFGKQHRAWTMLNRRDGAMFKRWEDFVTETVPWGLGSKPDQVRTMLESRNGKRATQRETVPEPRTKWDESTAHNEPLINIPTAKRLRAINRAPEIVGQLYDQGLISQVDAAKLGKKSLDPGQVAAEIARVVEETKGVETQEEKRKAIKAVAVRVAGAKTETPEEQCVKAFRKSQSRLVPLKVIVEVLESHELVVVMDWIKERLDEEN